MKHIICLLSVLFMTSCVSNVPMERMPSYYDNEIAAYYSLNCKNDGFKKDTICTMGTIHNTEKKMNEHGYMERYYNDYVTIFGGTYFHNNAFLGYTYKSKKNPEAISLDFVMTQSDWVFYNSAYDTTGKKLTVIQIDRKVISGDSVMEVFSIPVDVKYLEKYTKDDLKIKLYGDRGSYVFTIPAGYIKGFVRHLKEAKNAK